MISRMTFCSAQASGDARTPLGADAGDFGPALGVLLDDLEHGLAEGVHEPARKGRADALDHARAEVAGDAFERGRRHDLELAGAELQTMLGIATPVPQTLDLFAGTDAGGRPHHGGQLALAAHLDTQHGKAGLRAVEGHALDRAGQAFGRKVLGTGLHGAMEGGCIQSRRSPGQRSAARVAAALASA